MLPALTDILLTMAARQGGDSVASVLALVCAVLALALPPAAPALSGSPAVIGLNSTSHPSSSRWYANSDPTFSWASSAPGGTFVDGYACRLDRNPSGDGNHGHRLGPNLRCPADLHGTLGPTTYVKPAGGHAGKALVLSYRVRDNLSPQARTVVLTIRNSHGKLIKRLSLGSAAISNWHSLR
jgi:hypothetical protein